MLNYDQISQHSDDSIVFIYDDDDDDQIESYIIEPPFPAIINNNDKQDDDLINISNAKMFEDVLKDFDRIQIMMGKQTTSVNQDCIYGSVKCRIGCKKIVQQLTKKLNSIQNVIYFCSFIKFHFICLSIMQVIVSKSFTFSLTTTRSMKNYGLTNGMFNYLKRTSSYSRLLNQKKSI